eukprot:SAG31_NODE_34839_length_328_cov_1.550218_1_plen_60_part_10
MTAPHQAASLRVVSGAVAVGFIWAQMRASARPCLYQLPLLQPRSPHFEAPHGPAASSAPT